MISHQSLSPAMLRSLLRNGEITLGANRQLKIYGTLRCSSGKRMKRSNRVFFSSEVAAIHAGYRPCGNCLHTKYLAWKATQ